MRVGRLVVRISTLNKKKFVFFCFFVVLSIQYSKIRILSIEQFVRCTLGSFCLRQIDFLGIQIYEFWLINVYLENNSPLIKKLIPTIFVVNQLHKS